MLIEQLVGRRIADDPREAQTPGHKLLLRSGAIRQIGTGIYALLPLGQRTCAKIERIIREEMDAIGGQEILMPVTTPAELWQESGRYDVVGHELVRFTDRSDHPMVLNMTHEEVVVEVARSQVDSYRQFPFMLYQVQTKFRDEPRSRGGLIRVREFTMKDAYSFHRTQDDMDDYYKLAHRAYARIFKRVGMRDVVDVEADTGMMGGKVSHEFMLLNPVGEDTIVTCKASGYRANREVATCQRTFDSSEAPLELADAPTPGKKTIEEVAAFLGVPESKTCKCVAFVGDGERPILAFIRGDLDVNVLKLKHAVQSRDLRPMRDDEFDSIGAVAGYTGPVGLKPGKVALVYDESVAKTPNLVVGGNEPDLHLTGFNFDRDAPKGTVTDIYEVREGDPCPLSGEPLQVGRGIEVGNIFQLGLKYSEAMGFQYSEEDGSLRHPLMGCYGIGVGRAMASVAEESHDENGIMWPVSIAPFQVHICTIQAKKEEVASAAKGIYGDLVAAGIETVLDARGVGAGFMFADADLVGAPVRVVVSPRNLANGVAEIKYRVANPPEGLPGELPVAGLAEALGEILGRLARPFTFHGVEV